MLGLPLLTTVVFSPLLGVFLLLFVERNKGGLAKTITLVTTVVSFIASLPLYFQFNAAERGFQFVEKVEWIPTFGIDYHLGLDGISLYLILLTTFLSVIAVLGSWTAVEKHPREFMISLLLLEVGMLGVFLSLDVFLFYVFWEVMLIPMYLLIGIWGGDRRLYASIKFFIFTMAGSVLMLAAIIYMAILNQSATGQITFNLLEWYNLQTQGTVQLWLFSAFALAFAIKVPMFPLHTWLPDAHVQAPTAGSVILAGVLLKMGAYGYIRFALPLYPEAAQLFAPYLMIISVIGIIYGALVAMIQPDMKKLVAYSSVSHLGFVMLGIFALNEQGMQGSMIQMLNHGISTGALFLLVGMLYERRHTKLIADYGGIVKVMPLFTIAFMIITFSSIGLPGLNGFVGEFMILIGAFQVNMVLTIISASGVIFAAIYMLWMAQRVFFGENTNPKNQNLKDLSIREMAVLLPLIFFAVLMGVYPQPFFADMKTSVGVVLERIHQVDAKHSIIDDYSVKSHLGFTLERTDKISLGE